MTFCLAVLLLMPDDLPVSLSEPEPEVAPLASPDASFVRVRGGLWSSRQFHFEATTTASTGISSKQETLGSAGIDLGPAILGDRVVFFGSVEGAFGNRIRMEDVGLCVGFRDWADPGATAGVPQEAMIYAGPIYGKFDVTTPGFVELSVDRP